MHAQCRDRRIIGLTSLRKFIHGREDGADDAMSVSCAAFGRRPWEALYSPLLASRIESFNHPVSVGDDQIARTKLDDGFLVPETTRLQRSER
jgi:hypothetical protein